jgi:hypothetical protein
MPRSRRRWRVPAWWPDALVLASLPGYGSHEVGSDWDAELNVRTRCPVHRGVLSEDATFNRGALSTGVDDELLGLAYGSTADIPHAAGARRGHGNHGTVHP